MNHVSSSRIYFSTLLIGLSNFGNCILIDHYIHFDLLERVPELFTLRTVQGKTNVSGEATYRSESSAVVAF